MEAHKSFEKEKQERIEKERQEIIKRYRFLRKRVDDYCNVKEGAMIRKAYDVALDAHKGIRRKSGEPYIYHPIEVARITADEIWPEPTTVAAALLHDVVEDNEDWEIEDIEKEFGKQVAVIVDGVTKIPKDAMNTSHHQISQQAENYRKILIALAKDPRAIFVKLADRLHNMRTLEAMPKSNQLKISAESMYLYAPLAHKLGLYNIKTELEDLYLKYTHTDEYNVIYAWLEENAKERNKYIKDFIAPLETALKESGIKARVFGRTKSVHSIWKKMQKQGVFLDEIYDIFAIRIVIDEPNGSILEKQACWRTYSIVTDIYHSVNLKRLRDWISHPRPNGYESLHTTVNDTKKGRWVEIQIRTERMDEIAEKGYAAHWKYKEETKKTKKGEVKNIDDWLLNSRKMIENYAKDQSAVDFVEEFREHIVSDYIWVFTPKGDIISLPKGSTPVDFAFEIHSEVGKHCLGAKVNKKAVKLSTALQNSDQVSILTSKNHFPNVDWLNFVKTSKARHGIKNYLTTEKRELIKKGRVIFERKCKSLKMEPNEDLLKRMRVYFKLKQAHDVLYHLGKGSISPKQITEYKKWLKNHPQEVETNTKENKNNKLKPETKAKTIDEVVLGGDFPFEYELSSCCNPINGDPIFAFFTAQQKVKIHRISCPNASSLMAKYAHRIKNARWSSDPKTPQEFVSHISISGNDRKGILNELAQLAAGMDLNIKGIKLLPMGDGLFGGYIKVSVEEVLQINIMMEKIRKIEGVTQVMRQDRKEEDGKY